MWHCIVCVRVCRENKLVSNRWQFDTHDHASMPFCRDPDAVMPLMHRCLSVVLLESVGTAL